MNLILKSAYGIIAFTDIMMLSITVLGGTKLLPSYETTLVGSAIIIIHLLAAFHLLNSFFTSLVDVSKMAKLNRQANNKKIIITLLLKTSKKWAALGLLRSMMLLLLNPSIHLHFHSFNFKSD